MAERYGAEATVPDWGSESDQWRLLPSYQPLSCTLLRRERGVGGPKGAKLLAVTSGILLVRIIACFPPSDCTGIDKPQQATMLKRVFSSRTVAAGREIDMR
jgi:hypothetical protein